MLTTETFRARYPAGAAPDPGDAERLVQAATAWMETQTERFFSQPKEVIDLVPGNGYPIIWLREVPLDPPPESGAEVLEVDEADYIGAPFDAFDADEFALRGRQVYRVPPDVWRSGREYRLIYWIGYELDEGPEDVMEAVAQIAEWLWNQQQTSAGDGGIRSERLGDYQYQLGGDGVERLREDIPWVFDVIAKWRRMPV